MNCIFQCCMWSIVVYKIFPLFLHQNKIKFLVIQRGNQSRETTQNHKLYIDNRKKGEYQTLVLNDRPFGNASAVSFFRRCARLRLCAYSFHCSIQKRRGKLGRTVSFNESHVLYSRLHGSFHLGCCLLTEMCLLISHFLSC